MSGNTTKSSIDPYSAPLSLFLGSISLVTVVMNILVLYAVKTEKTLQTVGNIYIVSLSIADLVVGAAVMPLNIVYVVNGTWILGIPACLFWLSVDYVASTASIFSLFVLCVDRYRSVQQPLKYLKYRTKMRASLTILGAWFLSFLWVIPILGWQVFHKEEERTQNTTKCEKESSQNIAKCETDFSKVTWFKLLTAVVNFYMPSVIMLWLYLKIFRTVREHCQHRQLINGSSQSSSENRSIHPRRTKDEEKMCPQKQILDENIPPKDQHNSTQPKKMEATLHLPNTNKSAKSDSRSNSKVFKWNCFPFTTTQSKPGLDKTGNKYVCVVKKDQNEEEPCSQESDLSNASVDQTSAEADPCRNDSNPSPKGACGPQEKTEDKDVTGLSYLKKTWQRLHSHSKSHIQRLYVNRERKAARQLGVIMAAFILCWIPYFILYTVIAFHSCKEFPKLHMLTIWLGYLNSTLNPFLYPLCNENVKKTFKKILHIH
ncbi:HRH1 protein, partial [Eudromia elegans]|nr:HRH1 protein [Eudromia elegans]